MVANEINFNHTLIKDIYIANNSIYRSQFGIIAYGYNWTIENNEIIANKENGINCYG
jgi:hypothetical protein